MNPELQNTLAMLANKMGTTSERLWPLLVAKAKFEAWACLIGGLGFTALFVFASVLCWRKRDDWDSEPGTFIFGLIAIIPLIIALAAIGDAAYPEAAALQSLFHK